MARKGKLRASDPGPASANVSFSTRSTESSFTTPSVSAARSPAETILVKSQPTGPKKRITRSSLAALDDSSAASPTNDWSASDSFTTPMTSTVPTPAPSEVNKPSSVAKSAGRRIEVVIEVDRPTAGSARALRQSKYSMTSKRKRDIVEDSDEEYSDQSPDTAVARRLQKEEDEAAEELTARKAKVQLPATFKTRIAGASSRLGESVQNDEEDEEEEEASDFADLKVMTRTRSNRRRNIAPRNGTAARRSISKNVPDSDEDEDEDEDSDEDLSFYESEISAEPPMKKQKSAAKPLARRALSQASRQATTGNRSTSAAASEAADEVGASERVVSDSELTELSAFHISSSDEDSDEDQDGVPNAAPNAVQAAVANRRAYRSYRNKKKVKADRNRLEKLHPQLVTMWTDLEKMPVLKSGKADQPTSISRLLKGFQLEGLAWMKEMEKMEWKGGLLGDEMGLGKTIQAVSLIMSDWPAKNPSLVLVPPVALMQWVSEIDSYTDGTLKTLIFHGTNSKSKNLTVKDLKKFDVIMMSYNSLESMYRKQEKGFKRKEGIYKEKSIIHQTRFHRIILDEAHSIKTRTTMTAKACFALQTEYRWCLTGTPLQNRIGEFFSLIRFLNIQPFASYFCKMCDCSTLEWTMNDDNRCTGCNHTGMQHVSVFNQELLNPIQRFGNQGPGREAFRKLRLMTDRIMLRRLKKDHTNSMELPVKEIFVERQFFGEEENDFANSIMTNGQRKFDTYVASGILLNNYANIFGLIMQMRQVADHPDLILKKNSEGAQNVIVCCICDDVAEEAIRSRCKHDFCRSCAKSYLSTCMDSGDQEPRCPQCHIALSIDLEQPEIEQDEMLVKKSSIINRIKMENWTSSSKIELLVHELHKLRSDKASHKSIIFSQFTTMLQLIEWRLRRAGITTVMLDGSMTPAQRQASIDHFMKDVDVECFLVSLKAGGVALNLTEASRVFIVDPWWNPAAEWQSADRCHRIGQTRPCTITRLCIEDSVESRMVLLQEKKTNMINSTINSDDAAMDSLSPEDLQFLFRGT